MDNGAVIQHTIQAATASAKWGGTAGAIVGALSFNEWLALAGFMVAVIGTLINSRVNYYYRQREYLLKLQEDTRAQERHDAITAGWKQ